MDRSEDNFRQRVIDELKDLNHSLKSLEAVTEKALDMAEEHERTLYGHPEGHRRDVEPGLVNVVDEIAKAYVAIRTVAKAGWALIGVGALSLVGMWITLYFSVLRGGL